MTEPVTAAGRPLLEARLLGKTFGGARNLVALRDVTLELQKGEFLCLMGPSGCGKSTLLRLLSGLLPPTTGDVWIDGAKVLNPSPDTALVFQEYNRSLLPWRTAAENVALAFDQQKLASDKVSAAVKQALELVGLSDFADFRPWELSGGMQQRVAIARALARGPKILLMDEPLGSLDAPTKENLEDQLLSLWRQVGLTVIFVTHDLDQALYLASRIVVLSPRPGQIVRSEDITLAYPRDQIETRNSTAFGLLRASLRQFLHQS